MIIQTIGLDPSGAFWTDGASNVSSLDPTGAVQVDAEHPARNRKVVGSNPTSGSISAGKVHQARRAYLGGSGGGNLSTWTDAHRHCNVPSGKWSCRAVWCASRDCFNGPSAFLADLRSAPPAAAISERQLDPAQRR
jgi:hypothetical protein